MSAGQSPWTHRRWRDGICRPDLVGRMVMLWVMMLLFGGVAAGIAYKAPHMLHFSRVRWVVLIPGGFGAVGLAFLIGALVSTARWLRFSRCLVRMRTMPGVIGGHFRGEALLPERFPADTDVRMELICETTRTTPGKNSDDHDSVSVSRDWEHTLRVTANASYTHDGHCVIPFDFTVPYGLPDETAARREENTRIEIQWKLRVFARINGPDLDMTYRVPVFQTGESDPTVKGDTGAEKSLDAFLRDTGEQRRVRFELVQGLNVCICDAHGMKAGLAVVPTVFGLAFLGGAVLVAWNALPMTSREIFAKAEGWYNLFKIVPIILSLGACMMVVVLSGFGLLMLFIGLRSLVSRRTWVYDGFVNQRLRLFGIPWRRRCACADVAGVNCGDSSSSNGRTWRSIVIERNARSRVGRTPWLYVFSRMTVATDIATEREAEELMVRLRQEMHLRPDADGFAAAEERA